MWSSGMCFLVSAPLVQQTLLLWSAHRTSVYRPLVQPSRGKCRAAPSSKSIPIEGLRKRAPQLHEPGLKLADLGWKY